MNAMKFQISQIIGIIGALCVIVGAFLPWATWSSITVAGVEGDGKITFLLGLIAGVLLPWSKKRAGFPILGLIIFLIGCYDAYDVSKGVVPGVKPNIGIGLFATHYRWAGHRHFGNRLSTEILKGTRINARKKIDADQLLNRSISYNVQNQRFRKEKSNSTNVNEIRPVLRN
jgi:hypothetical protein